MIFKNFLRVSAGLLLLSGALLPNAAAQTTNLSTWAAVEGFQGHYTCVLTSDWDNRTRHTGSDKWSHMELSGTVDFELKRAEPGSNEFRLVHSQAGGTYRNSSDEVFGKETKHVEDNASFSGAVEDPDIKLELNPRTGKWSFFVGGRLAEKYEIAQKWTNHVQRGLRWVDETGEATLQSNWYPHSNIYGTIPPNPDVLDGRGESEIASKIEPAVDRRHCEVTLIPESGDLILEVDSPDYDNWRPTVNPKLRAGPDTILPGTSIEFTATLKKRSGELATVPIDRMEWELLETSKEPGIAINYPWDGYGADFDLRFGLLPGQTPNDRELQHITTPVVRNSKDRARILPLDWGGWSTLRVTAYVHNGPRVVGQFKRSGERDIRLPKRDRDSHIADSWKKAWGVEGKPDSADDETSPKGDGYEGDGLTLYEEYRGFYENGEHKSGDPKRKDYFAVNDVGANGELALAYFEQVTGFVVHPYLRRSEWYYPERIINRNHDKGAHAVDQHGVLIDYHDEEGFCEAYGGPGTPGKILIVGIVRHSSTNPTTNPGVSYVVATIAHELLHTVNVWHHGGGDQKVAWIVRGGILRQAGVDRNGQPAGNGNPIRVYREIDDAEITADLASIVGEGNSMPVWLGVAHGQHSGIEDCLMRYDISFAFHSPQGKLYLANPREITGTRLCNSGVGNGVNRQSRRPCSRYQDTMPGRGNCQGHLRVNDK